VVTVCVVVLVGYYKVMDIILVHIVAVVNVAILGGKLIPINVSICVDVMLQQENLLKQFVGGLVLGIKVVDLGTALQILRE
jgi:hypothetical protein